MAFIEKTSPTVLNIKLTSKGRELLSTGDLTFDYFAIGDSEMDYVFNAKTGFEADKANILKPLDNNPSILSFITANVSGNPYNILPAVGSHYVVVNSTKPSGFFTDNGNEFLKDRNHVKQPYCMVAMDNATGGTKILLKKSPLFASDGNLTEPTINDYILIRWTLGESTTDLTINKNHPSPYLVYKIENIIGSVVNDNAIVTLDRNIPDLRGYTTTGINAGALIYEKEIILSGATGSLEYSPDYLDKSVLAFLQNSQCPTIIFPFWNMSIIFTDEIAGAIAGLKKYSQFNTAAYGGFVNYIQNQAAAYKKLGVIHYTNNSPANTYAEGFYLKTPVLDIPTIMWHKKNTSTLGARFIAGEGKTLAGLNAHYYDLVDENDPTIIVGKVFDELKLFVIEDQELLFAMSYKSNRTWTLPDYQISGGGGCYEKPEDPPVFSLVTVQGQPAVNSIQNISANQIVGWQFVTDYGIEYRAGTTGEFIKISRLVLGKLTSDSFPLITLLLNPAEVYQYRAYIVANNNTIVSANICETQPLYPPVPPPPPVPPAAPTITTVAASNILETSASAGGNITSEGTQSVTARGVVWSTSANPTIANSKTTNGTGAGAFASNITGLAAGTTYNMRAYATNSVDTAYGNNVTFTTATPPPVYAKPTATTGFGLPKVGDILFKGNQVTSNGGIPILQYGVLYTTNPAYSTEAALIYDNVGTDKVYQISDTGDIALNLSFVEILDGARANTTYYYRAFAKNASGYGYGEVLSAITPLDDIIPAPTTTPLSIVYSTPNCEGSLAPMPSNTSTDITLSYNIGVPGTAPSTKGKAFGCVVCNGVRKFYSAALLPETDNSGTWTMNVKSTDNVELCVSTTTITGLVPYATIEITSASGNFSVGTPAGVYSGNVR